MKSYFISLKQITTVITIFFGLSTLLSCTQPVIEDVVKQKSHVTVDVRAFYFELEEFGSNTRTGSSPATRLSFAVFDSEGALVETVIHQKSSSETFGTIKMELFPGEYQMVAVAHNGDADVEIKSVTSVILPGFTFTDTFAKVQSLTVESGKDNSLSMNLPRLTSAFVLRLTDTPPADAKEIQVVVNTGGIEPTSLEIDPTSGLAKNNWRQACTIPIGDLVAGNDVPIYFIGLFQTEPWPVTVKATAYATDGTEIIIHTINNVPLVANQKTIATGNFFKSQSSGTFTINSTWDTDKEISY